MLPYRRTRLALINGLLTVQEETAIGSNVYDDNPRTFALEDLDVARKYMEHRMNLLNGVDGAEYLGYMVFPTNI